MTFILNILDCQYVHGGVLSIKDTTENLNFSTTFCYQKNYVFSHVVFACAHKKKEKKFFRTHSYRKTILSHISDMFVLIRIHIN